MLINGKFPSSSGTIVALKADQLAITVAGSNLPVEFAGNDGGPPKGALDPATGAIRLHNCDNALGSYVTFIGNAPDGQPVHIAIAVYTLGEPVGARVIHYTVR